MADNLEVWWCGQRDHYLCVRDPEIRDLGHVEPALIDMRPRIRYEKRTAERARLLLLLAVKDRWSVEALRLESGLEPRVFHGVLQRLEKSRHVRRLMFGVVALRSLSPQRKAEP